MAASIQIQELSIQTQLGITEEERSRPQPVVLTLQIEPNFSLCGLSDDINNTLDYHLLSLSVIEIAKRKPRHLLETLVEDLMSTLLANYPIQHLQIEAKKFALPMAQWVSITMSKSAHDLSSSGKSTNSLSNTEQES